MLACTGIFTCALVPISFVSGSDAVATHPDSSLQPSAEEGAPAPPEKREAVPASVLPPPPAGVTDLKFNEFFELPIGPRGLTLTQKLRSLDGKRVRVVGYMVRQGEPHPGFFLFAPIPLRLHDSEYGLADDLPPSILFVHLPEYKDKIVPYMAGPLLLVGALSVGNQEEADGRISLVRLTLDTVPPAMAERIRRAAVDPPPHPLHR